MNAGRLSVAHGLHLREAEMRTNRIARTAAVAVMAAGSAFADCGIPEDRWTATGGAGIAQSVLALGWDSTGGLIAGGYEDRNDLGTRRDWRITAYDPDGRTRWTQVAGSPTGRDEEVTAVAAQHAGGAYIAGSWNENEWRILSLNGAGGERWA